MTSPAQLSLFWWQKPLKPWLGVRNVWEWGRRDKLRPFWCSKGAPQKPLPSHNQILDRLAEMASLGSFTTAQFQASIPGIILLQLFFATRENWTCYQNTEPQKLSEDGTLLLWREAARLGVVQPGEGPEETLLRPFNASRGEKMGTHFLLGPTKNGKCFQIKRGSVRIRSKEETVYERSGETLQQVIQRGPRCPIAGNIQGQVR